MLSSMVPSQSLSSPSQTSACGLFEHVLKPPPATQPPGTATGCAGLQLMEPTQFGGVARPQATGATPSSATPSQSLSQPSHTSGDGLHTAGQPSSVVPLQLSSCPLQVSVVGQWGGLPHLSAPSSTVASQLLSL